MDFGGAIRLCKVGRKVRRKGWRSRGMFIALMPALRLPPFNSQEHEKRVDDRTAKFIGPDEWLDCQPYFAMRTAAGGWQPGWVAGQADMLAEDWEPADDARAAA